MPTRKLYCIHDLTHAAFVWTATDAFAHMRTYDCLGNTVGQWTMPAREAYRGELRCSVCGGRVFAVRGPLAVRADKVVACDFLGRCQDFFADENARNLEMLLANLAATTDEADIRRLTPMVRVLVEVLGDDPLAKGLLDRYNINGTFI